MAVSVDGTHAAAQVQELEITQRRVAGEAVRLATHADRLRPPSPRQSGARSTSRAFSSEAVSAGIAASWCGDERSSDDTANALSNAPHIKVVYAYPAEQASRFRTYADLIQSDARAAATRLAAESGQSKTVRFDLGTRCGSAYLDITSVRLPSTSGHYLGGIDERYWRIAADVQAALGDGDIRNLAIYADYLGHPGWPAGHGGIYLDDRPGIDNPHNVGGLVAVLYGSGGADFYGGAGGEYRRVVFEHETGHLLGAVQNSAPNASGALHCNDEEDLMCYGDGGPQSAPFSRCAGDFYNDRFDCGSDDYFAVSPQPGSYLASHWNIYDSAFLCRLERCFTRLSPPVARLTADPSPVAVGSTVTLSAAGSTDDGQIVRHQWDAGGDGDYERDSGAANSIAGSYRTPGTRTVRVRVTDDDGAFGEAQATLTVTAYQGRDTCESARAHLARAKRVLRERSARRKRLRRAVIRSHSGSARHKRASRRLRPQSRKVAKARRSAARAADRYESCVRASRGGG